MKKIVEHISDKKHYVSDACIVWCFDARFATLRDRFIKSKGFQNVDLVCVAGGAKDIAAPEREADREYVQDQLRKSIALHHTKEVVLMVHNECGAYGGKTDAEFYMRELERARGMLKNYFQAVNIDVPISLYYADFEGVNEIE
ncbi:MAG: carbonic anhydrase [Patescibacteria group bacterium]